MFDKLNSFKGWLSVTFSCIAALLGVRGVLFLILFVLMLVDYLTGMIAAIKRGEWKSAKAREGVAHKIGMIVVVVVSGVMDMCLQVICGVFPDIPVLWIDLLFPLAVTWYIITELGSIIENAALLGAPVPKWLMKALEVGKKIVDNVGDKNNSKNNDKVLDK